jgi:hypothetical protein
LRPFATELKAPPSCCSAAVEAVLLVVELNGPTMMARIGVMRARTPIGPPQAKARYVMKESKKCF